MTAAENQAIQALIVLVETIDRKNDDAHNVIFGKLDKFVDHCAARKIEVDAELASRKVVFDAEIAAAEVKAVALATAPSQSRIARQWLGQVSWKAITMVGVFAGTVLGLFAILEHFQLL